MSYYATNHLQDNWAASDAALMAERQERAETEAGRWFADLTQQQTAEYNSTMSVARAYLGSPKWERISRQAKAVFAETTQDAARISDMVLADLLSCGEVSEETSAAADELAGRM